MLIDLPLKLPVGKDTLHPSPNCDCPLTTNNQLQLVAWRVSADSSKQERFRAKQLSLSCARGERKQTLIITLPGRSGRSGAGTEVFNLRPPCPRYAVTWEVTQVLACVRSWGDNVKLDRKHVTRKLVVLLALVLAHRSSNLIRLSLNGRK